MVKEGERRLYLTPICFRWLTWFNAILLILFGAKKTNISVIILVFFYNLAISFFMRPIRESYRKRPLLLFLDLAFCGYIIHLTGGWGSPFYLYSFSPLLVAALFFKYKGALLSASAFSLIYSFVLFLNGYTIDVITKMGRLDSLISNYISFFLIAIFFAHPASLIDMLEKSKIEITKVKEDLEKTNRSLSISVKLGPLSERELEVLTLLAEGKSNKEIAAKLFLSEITVRNHVSSIFKKLNIKSRHAASAYF